MIVIRARNVQQILPEALHQLERRGVDRESRNGPVKVFPEPATSVYERPCERVMFWPDRDCNPFFHLMESLWMLAGRNDVEFVTRYVKTMANFSDDGKTFHGAYGHRWINYFGFNQLDEIIKALAANPDDRRCVLQIWDALADLGQQGKDFPCNIGAHFQVTHEGSLDMTVFNRSNDVVWGAYGANAVHFSMLHEYVASRLQRPVGVYRQVSDNLHAYHDTLAKVAHLSAEVADPLGCKVVPDPYATGQVRPFPLMTVDPARWHEDLQQFFRNPYSAFNDPFFNSVVKPMQAAHDEYRLRTGEGRYDAAIAAMRDVAASDWRKAGEEWLQRRKANYVARLKRAQDDGVDYEQR